MTRAGIGGRALVLIGMSGVGKTRVARLLAERLGWPLHDVDAEIEARAGMTIPEIFAREGEAGFRRREREAIARLEVRERPAVIALGGGAVGDPATERWLRTELLVVWLDASPPTIAARLAGDRDRPLLAGLDPAARRARIEALSAERSPAYARCATWRIDTEARSPEAVAAEICARLQPVRTVRVELGERGHEIGIEPGAIGRLGAILRRSGFAPGRCALVCCERVEALYGETVRAGLEGAGFEPVVSVLPTGEPAKRLEVLERLCRRWRAARIDRAMPVLAVGGGALTDVAGFAAAVYRRGVRWVACPTTLLGMVDAAIGGKTGLNLERTKNLVGAVWQPVRVVIDPLVLRSLPGRELRSGWGEVLKYALIGPDAVRTALAALPGGGLSPPSPERAVELAEAIAACAGCKAQIVAEDERDTTGRRQVLNFGHTVGHAIEASVPEGAVSHGECVVLGMRAAIALSRAAGLLDAAGCESALGRLAGMPWPGVEPPPLEAVVQQLQHDKKAYAGRVRFVLLERVGRPRPDCELPDTTVREAVARLLADWRRRVHVGGGCG